MGVTQQGDEAGARRGMSFSKVKRVRSFDDVVEQVRRSVADGAIGAGERLPSERELAEQFGVSRATLREALRALEAMGILEIRLGAHGGAFAREQPGDRLTAAFREAFTTQVALSPAETRVFRASFHADNVTWTRLDPGDMAALESGVEDGERGFLLELARSTQIPLRYALAETLEAARTAALGADPLSREDLRKILDMLRDHRRAEARRLLFRLLAGEDTGGHHDDAA
jgi:GntR family transcriptional repressor for pyruvate dehydrogenase complex